MDTVIRIPIAGSPPGARCGRTGSTSRSEHAGGSAFAKGWSGTTPTGDMDEAVLDQRGLSLQAHHPLTTTAPMESVSACPKIVTLSKIVH